MQSVNPATGEILSHHSEHGPAEIEARLARAAATFRTYRRTTFADRARWMREAARILEGERDRIGRLITQEIGRPVKGARSEVDKCALACRYYADNAERILADEEIKTTASESYVRYLPLGPVLAIMPWNYPLWQVFRFSAPTLMAGNVGLLKHASNVPGCALEIEGVLRRAGFPEGAFQTLLVGAGAVADIIADHRVAAITITGSEGAGRRVGEAAGRAIKKVVLELGGSDAFIVMPSADLEGAVRSAITSRCMNAGQTCVAAKRFIVHEAVYPEFERRMKAGLEALRVGDPTQETTDMGPLATAQGLADVTKQVTDSVRAGARLVTGGKRLPGTGYFYAPTALADIPRSAPAYHEEIFGPVALLHRARDVDDAIAIANDSVYGLGSAIWTDDPAERRRFIDELEAGSTYVNTMVISDIRLPFGGVKQSGHGRELGAWGMREFMNAKTVFVK